MNKEKIQKLEQRANEIFGSRSVVSIAETKVANKGYNVRISMQGVPFEISAMGSTPEEAQENAYTEFEKNLNAALKQTLFPTQSVEKYREVELTNEQFHRLFKNEELMSEEYLDQLVKETKAMICQLDNGNYECVIESPYMCLHARGVARLIESAIYIATMNAHDVFTPELIRVGSLK